MNKLQPTQRISEIHTYVINKKKRENYKSSQVKSIFI